ncbi:hypothetical protein CI105_06640 [Candidatus Izimaplasma bacterium ZiA1]|uniref:HD domain-containing phosphohydrolase n=1 Tax=Candidatus Izimoplasma sp. ZiA1 TaxID=2024899 RepID=UPI000BAA4649|nr:hypothetical protein CI105_06640 [Candidatus Izimaplasma bacterium ZiA1]
MSGLKQKQSLRKLKKGQLLELITNNLIERGLVVNQTFDLLYQKGDYSDFVNSKELTGFTMFTLEQQKLITEAVKEINEENKYVLKSIDINDYHYNIIVMPLVFETYFLVIFEKKYIRLNQVLNYNKQMSASLEEKLSLVDNFLSNAQTTGFVIDDQFSIFKHSKDIDNLFLFEGDLIGKQLKSLEPKIYDFPRLLSYIKEVIEHNYTKMMQVKTLDNNYYNIKIAPFFNYQNEITGTIITFQDITLLKMNELEILSQRNELEKIMNSIDFGVANHEIILDEEGTPIDYRYINVNSEFCNMVQKEKKDLVGKKVSDVFPTMNKKWVKLYGQVAITLKSVKLVEYSDAFDKYFEVHAFSFVKGQFVVSFSDVTALVRVNQDLQNRIIRHNMLLEYAKTGFFEVDFQNKTVEVDEFVESLFKEQITFENYEEEFSKRLKYDGDIIFTTLIQRLISGEIKEIRHKFKFLDVKTNQHLWIRTLVIIVKSRDLRSYKMIGLFTDITEEMRKEELIKERNKLLSETTKVANMARFLYNAKTQTFEESKELSDFLEVPNFRELEQFRTIIHEDDIAVFDYATDYIIDHPDGKTTNYRLINGPDIRYIQSSIYGQTNDYGETETVYGLLKDITDIEKSRIAALHNQKAFEHIFNSSPAGIFLLDDDFKIARVNKTYVKLLELSGEKDLTLKQLLGKKYEEVIKEIKEKGIVKNLRIEYKLYGYIKFFNITIQRIDEAFFNNYQGTMIDVTSDVEKTREIDYLANHDILTDLYNRNNFEEYIQKTKFKENDGVVVCDVDGLKLVNDAFGHLKGDELLIRFAAILKKVYKNDLVYRIGGDEFCIIIKNAVVENMERKEKLIKDEIQALDLYGISFDVSVGYDIIEDDETTFFEVYSKAENIMYRRKLTERSSRKSKTLDTIMETLNEKTEETKEHCDRVADYSEKLLKKIGYTRQIDIEEIRLLARIHDIGKITIAEEILNKPASLTIEEYERIKTHAEAGYKIVKNIIDSENIALAVLHHHEKVDGSGYPYGLIQSQIPLFARIIAITDAYDAMVSERPYKDKFTETEAINELKKHSGTQFDSEYVDLFIEILKNPNH